MNDATSNRAGHMAIAGASRPCADVAVMPLASATSWLISTDAGYPATGTAAVRTVPVAKQFPAHKHTLRPSEPSP